MALVRLVPWSPSRGHTSGGGGGITRRELTLRALFSVSLRPESTKWGLKECHVSPCSLHLSQGLRKITPCRVTWGPQLNVFQPASSLHLYGLVYITVGSYFASFMGKNWKIYSHSMCRHLVRPCPLKSE